MDSLKLLRQSHLCAHLTSDEMAALMKIVTIREVEKGGILFLEGDEATGFYVLLSGGVRVYKASPDGREYTLHRIQPGQIFAEAAVFHGGKYPANCTAVSDAVTAFFPKDGFVRLIETQPQISLKMIGSLSAYLRDFNQTIEMLSLKEVSARLATWLLNAHYRSGKATMTLPMSKGELADILGTINETLSRNLRKLDDHAVIKVDGKTITILDLARLEAIATGEKI